MSLSNIDGSAYYQAPRTLGPAHEKKVIRLSKPRLKRKSKCGWFCESPEAVSSGLTPEEAYLAWAEIAPRIEEYRLNRAEELIRNKKRAKEVWEKMYAHKP